MRLKSDFIDYYDHEFIGGSREYTLQRPSINPELPRERMFELFKDMKYQVPLYGRHKGVFATGRVIEHIDELAHQGEGKILRSLDELDDSNTLKVRYVESEHNFTIRKLMIGAHLFELQYENKNDWRSNGPGCKITLVGAKEGGAIRRHVLLMKYPLLAFDFVPTDVCGDYYIDINTSPSWRHTLLEKMLPPSLVYEMIKEYVDEVVLPNNL